MIRFQQVPRALARQQRVPLAQTTLALAIVALLVERLSVPYVSAVEGVLKLVLLALLALELAGALSRALTDGGRARRHAFDLVFLVLFVPIFAWAQARGVASKAPIVAIVLRGLLVIVAQRLRGVAGYVRGISIHPARTVTVSFAAAILVGAVFLVQPFATVDGRGLSLLDAVFTATSAVCVTGLVVVDTATVFTLWGRLILLVLIQVGGLGIMILSYFAAFALRRSLSVEDKLLMQYMLNEADTRALRSSLRRIVLITLSIEAVGAALLFARLRGLRGAGGPLFYSVFHAVSAFCNAGFALFTDSLSGYRSDPLVNAVVCGLIIAGGLSFAVLSNAARALLGRRDASGRSERLSLNSRVVLLATGVLIAAGMVLFYAMEHTGALRSLGLGTQYLAAFFQSVTLRTAGFNTLPIDRLRPATLLVMAAFMFIGGAAGSTAGGIKVSTAAVIGAHLRAVLRDRDEVLLFHHSIPAEVVTKALMIFVFAVLSVSAGAILLALTEKAPAERLFFEVVSAFGTVGLSAGITPTLSPPGRVVIVALMFMGRVGPLTLLAAAARRGRRLRVQYPAGDIVIG